MSILSRQSGLFVLALLLIGLIAAKLPTESKQYDYISIVQREEELQVSGSQRAFEKIKFKNKASTSTDCNYGELFQKVNELEAQGYELVENNVFSLGVGNTSRNYVLLRKPKP